eukprot:6065877-Pyramimonas_sp.AAC.1
MIHATSAFTSAAGILLLGLVTPEPSSGASYKDLQNVAKLSAMSPLPDCRFPSESRMLVLRFLYSADLGAQ